jgi:hypothetical protein
MNQVGERLRAEQNRNQSKLSQQQQTAAERPPARYPPSPQSRSLAIRKPKHSGLGENAPRFCTHSADICGTDHFVRGLLGPNLGTRLMVSARRKVLFVRRLKKGRVESRNRGKSRV